LVEKAACVIHRAQNDRKLQRSHSAASHVILSWAREARPCRRISRRISRRRDPAALKDKLAPILWPLAVAV
jgi:hypothetical protein